MDRIEWLRQQIAARLETARSACPQTDGHWWRRDWAPYLDGTREPVGPLYSGKPIRDEDGEILQGDFLVIYDEGAPSEEQFDHIIANDPRDTIARCEAELAILDHCIPGEAMDKMLDSGIISAEEYVSHEAIGAAVVRHLASAYRHHAGYEDHWGTAAPK